MGGIGVGAQVVLAAEGQADLFPELSGGNAGVAGAVESPAGVTASPANVAAAPGLADSDVSVMDFGHGL